MWRIMHFLCKMLFKIIAFKRNWNSTLTYIGCINISNNESYLKKHIYQIRSRTIPIKKGSEKYTITLFKFYMISNHYQNCVIEVFPQNAKQKLSFYGTKGIILFTFSIKVLTLGFYESCLGTDIFHMFVCFLDFLYEFVSVYKCLHKP